MDTEHERFSRLAMFSQIWNDELLRQLKHSQETVEITLYHSHRLNPAFQHQQLCTL
ncbi:hypothetical protein D3C76_1884970 [compost metagenome]